MTEDTSPPVISDLSASGGTGVSAIVAWTTDEEATSQVEYGVDVTYGSSADPGSRLATSHSVALNRLTAGTTYHYRVKSRDIAGNEAVSADQAFVAVASQNVKSMSGRVMYVDNTPGDGARVVVRNAQDASTDLAGALGDAGGYYAFYDLNPGTYYVNTVVNGEHSSDAEAIATISAGQVAVVDTLTCCKDLAISLGQTKTATLPGCSFCSKTVVNGPAPGFSWSAVSGATYYQVELRSTYTTQHPGYGDYTESVNTTGTGLVWPTDLSLLEYREFRLDVRVYAGATMVASDFELFCVDSCDGGWIVS